MHESETNCEESVWNQNLILHLTLQSEMETKITKMETLFC